MKGAASESLRLKRHCELPTPREICTPCQRNTYSVYPKYVTRFKSATYVPRFKFFVFITKTLLFRLNHFCCRRFLPCLTCIVDAEAKQIVPFNFENLLGLRRFCSSAYCVPYSVGSSCSHQLTIIQLYSSAKYFAPTAFSINRCISSI